MSAEMKKNGCFHTGVLCNCQHLQTFDAAWNSYEQKPPENEAPGGSDADKRLFLNSKFYEPVRGSSASSNWNGQLTL
jgi:hypothetical protein